MTRKGKRQIFCLTKILFTFCRRNPAGTTTFDSLEDFIVSEAIPHFRKHPGRGLRELMKYGGQMNATFLGTGQCDAIIRSNQERENLSINAFIVSLMCHEFHVCSVCGRITLLNI